MARLQAEQSDLANLALAAVAVPLVWVVALKWSPSLCVGSLDQVAQSFPLYQDLAAHAHGDWTHASYRAELLGGAKIHDVMGTLPLLQLFAWLGVGPAGAMNGVLFFAQIACAFFGARIALDAARLFSGKAVAASWGARLGVSVLTSFSPALAWKVTAGHHEEVFGTLLGVSVLALLLAARSGTVSLTLAVATLLVHLQAFQTKGQGIVYGALFLGPALAVAARAERPRRVLLVPVLVTAAALALSLPKLAGMVAHATSSDAARSLQGSGVIYSYITASLRDWAASIPWGMELVSSGRDASFWHEINFGFGPPLLLLLLLPWKRQRLLAWAVAVSVLIPVLFSMDAPGVAWTLSHVCPPIKAFRVPERSVLSFALVLPALASSALLTRDAPAPHRGWAVATIVAGIALFFVPQGVREVLVWAVPITLLLGPRLGWPAPASVPTYALLLTLGLGSLSAFKERLRPFAPEASLVDSPAKLAAKMRQAQPELNSALARIVLHFDLAGFQTNTGYVMGLSSLDGYLNPPRRFVALEAALSGAPENTLRNYYRLDEAAPAFAVLQPLYNVKFGAFPDHGLRLSPIGETAGPAWFSASIARVAGMEQLATALHAEEKNLATVAHRESWIVDTDEAVVAAQLPSTVSPDCERAAVRAVRAEIGGQVIELGVDVPADCPLTVATNYAIDLRATTDSRPLTVFPAYGALTGIWVPAGTRVVVLAAEPVVPTWSRLAWWLGLGLVVWALWETWRGGSAAARASRKIVGRPPGRGDRASAPTSAEG
jgi:hypothetical protein